MTLYEEMGVPPDALPEAIREAYRNAARVLHPDAQSNPVLKESAEVQMKRLNHLYEILSDPERRRQYDRELAGIDDRREPLIIQSAPRSVHFRRDPRGTIAWLTATAVGAAFIFWLATRESAPASYPPAPAAIQRTAAAILPRSSLERQLSDEVSRLRAELAAANADRGHLMKQLGAMQLDRKLQPPAAEARRSGAVPAPPQNLAGLAPAPLPAQAAAPEIPVSLVSPAAPVATHVIPPVPAARPAPNESSNKSPNESTTRWSGTWTYRPPQVEAAKTGLFPPEFIETVITEENGRIRGQYHARFRVMQAKISPKVDFRFAGPVTGNAGSFPWAGSGGARGEVRLRLISDAALEVTWSASSLGKSMGLESGTAVLNRKN